MNDKRATVTSVGVLDKGMSIVDLCERQASTGSDIARELGITVPTAHRLATALSAHGLLHRSEDGRYHLGPRFLSSRLSAVTVPVLEQLTREIGETTQLWVLRGDVRLCTASVISDAELRVALPVGSRLPLSAGGSAASALTGNMDGSPWVESISQRTPGVGSVSAPVLVEGATIAAVCAIAPLTRVQSTPGAMFGEQVVAAAHKIAASFGTD